jgi:WhiB family redox-sensing transcriptional regulator
MTNTAPDWRKSATCRGMNDDTFFPAPGKTAATNYAKSICAMCPARRACLEDALRAEGGRTKNYRFGVRGGKTPGQRYAIYTARRKQTQRVAV